MARRLPTPERLRERLRERLEYEPESGTLRWRLAPDLPKSWNNRFAGKEAFANAISRGYKQGAVDGVMLFAHRVIWAMVHDSWPDDDIDHIDGHRANNCLSNLRAVSHVENQRNMCRHRGNSSGVTGVSWHKRDQRWRAFIEVNRRSIHLGNFVTKDAAIAARAAANERFGFHAGHGKEAA